MYMVNQNLHFKKNQIVASTILAYLNMTNRAVRPLSYILVTSRLM